jgi:hypothetical protein
MSEAIIRSLPSPTRNAEITIWVEDSLTDEYLTQLWADPAMNLLVAGGRPGVKSLVETAARTKVTKVFGIVDRDFGSTNRDRWADPEVRVFRLGRHEIENYLLDANAMAGCSLNNQKLSVSEVQAKLLELAKQQTYWLACRSLLRHVDTELKADFPVPKVTELTSSEAAERFLESSPWLTGLSERVGRLVQPEGWKKRLHDEAGRYQQGLTDGSWVEHCSAGDMIPTIRSILFKKPKSQSIEVTDSDFAKAVSAWQIANDAIPADLLDLHDIVRTRVGLSPIPRAAPRTSDNPTPGS